MKMPGSLALTLLCSLQVFAQPDTLQQVDRLFAQWNNATPGGAVLISRGNQIIYDKAFGLADLEHEVPNTTQTIFESGSVAKQFTAAAILLLAREGKIGLDDDVHRYVPELPTYQGPITVRHLLQHTSGLKDWGVIGSIAGWPRTTRVYTQELALQIMCRQKSLNFLPGTQYSYSNSNYSLLVTIVERVSRQSLAAFTADRFFAPLGMTHTQWRDNFRKVVPNRAIAYAKNKSEYEQLMPFENIHGHGGLLTTTHDLLKWNQLLASTTFFGEELSSVRIQPGILSNGKRISYAAGLFIEEVNGHQAVDHSGATAGYRAWLAYYPKTKLTVCILSNDGNFNPSGIGNQVARLFLGSSLFREAGAPSGRPMTAAEGKKWAGTYRSVIGFDVIQFRQDGDRLTFDKNPVGLLPGDTLASGPNKWVQLPSGKLLSMAGTDTATFIRVPPTDATRPLSEFGGRYSSSEADALFSLEARGGQLMINRTPHEALALEPVFEDAFRDRDYNLYEFTRDKKGRVTGYVVSLSRALRVPFTRLP